MKPLISLFCLSFFWYTLAAQPAIEWQKTFGGNYFDQVLSIQQTTDGGYITTGNTASIDGDVIGNHGGNDFWVVKLSTTGSLEWSKALGGSDHDRPYEIQQTTDDGFIVAGDSGSNDGDVSGNHGSRDCWVVKLRKDGAIEWQKSFGGSEWDDAWSVRQTSDDGYIIAGSAGSSDGDVTGNHGGKDFWVIRLNNMGELIWQKSLGGSSVDIAYSIHQTSDGGYIVTGETSSLDGDITENHGNIDFWVLKLDGFGEIEWQKTFGGDGTDVASEVLQTLDGGYVVAGYVGSDVPNYHGVFDYWVIKLDVTGNIEWQKAMGGSGADWGRAITQLPDSSYVVFGAASSNDGDVIDHYEDPDFWLVKLSKTGDIIWQKILGGSQGEIGYAMDKTTDGGFVLAGYAWSEDGDLSGSTIHGYNDFWVVKLAPESVAIKDLPTPEPLILYPNPASQFIALQIPNQAAALEVLIRDAAGRDVLRQSLPVAQVNISNLLPGMYQVMVQTVGKTLSGWFRKI
jgi:hypothetical protein